MLKTNILSFNQELYRLKLNHYLASPVCRVTDFDILASVLGTYDVWVKTDSCVNLNMTLTVDVMLCQDANIAFWKDIENSESVKTSLLDLFEVWILNSNI